ncbi:hypothetical protein SeLEV6574_g00678 [Synchytrium endobioticum]|nr:hypothetical protein SeLEV6574_g00678 [Synchytrium endobioticum]
MWDLADGRCLQTNMNALDGAITALKMTSSGAYFVCAGYSTRICIMDASTLDTIRSCNVFDDWAACLTLYPTETRGVERLNIITFDGALHSHTLLDEFKLEIITPTDSRPAKMDFGTSLPAISMETNLFDKNMMIVMHQTVCVLYISGKSGPIFLTRLDEPIGQRWAGSKFMSARTVLLWTVSGHAYMYYIGPESELTHGPANQVPPSSVVLFSDGIMASFCSKLIPGIQDYLTYRATTLLASFAYSKEAPTTPPTSSTMRARPATLAYIPPSVTKLGHHLASFRQNSGHVTQWTFWASISGKQLSQQVGISEPAGIERDFKFVVIPAKEWNFEDLWPLPNFADTVMASTVTSIQGNKLAVGYVDGSIRVMPISTPFYYNVNDIHQLPDVLALIGHTNKVTALLAPNRSQCDGRRYLISGSDDCSVRVWDLQGPAAKHIVYSSHSSPVTGIIPSPIKDTVLQFISVSQSTKSFSLFKPPSPQVQTRFPGLIRQIAPHASLSRHDSLVCIHVRQAHGHILFELSNQNVLVFKSDTGALEQILEGDEAFSATAACDAKVICRPPGEEFLAANVRQAACALPLFTSVEAPPPLILFLFNTKRIIADLNVGAKASTPQSPPRSTSSASFLNGQMQISRPGASRANPPSPNKSNNDNPSHVNSSGNIQVDDPPDEMPVKEKLDTNLVNACFSALASWGFDPTIDQLYTEKLGMQKPRNGVCIGMRGANGFLSIMAPSNDDQPDQVWKTSPSVSAAKLLEILAIARSVLFTRNYEAEISILLTHYGALLPTRVGKGFCFPSFSFLGKYWQDPLPDLQQAARTLFASTVAKMESQDRDGVVLYWHSLLPTLVTNRKAVKTNMRAAVILGIITADHPNLIPVLVCKDVAQSLDLLIHVDAKSPYRAAAIELIGRGWSTWEPHINGSAVFRHVFASTGLIPLPHMVSHNRNRGLPVIGSGTGPSSASNTGSNSGSNGHNNTTYTGSSGGSPPTLSQQQEAVEQIPRELAILARQSVLMIATANPGLFSSTLTFDLGHARTAAERAGGMRLLGMFMSKKPLILYGSIPKIAEAMVRSLDPNIPTIREALLPAATTALAELVRVYPNASFHGASQRLAVGGPDGTIVLYDLKTATRMQVLEGHTKPVTAVSFSSDGKLLASFAVEENSVRFWQAAGGLLGAASALAGVVGGTVQLRQFRTFSAGPAESNVPASTILEEVSFEWVTERGVKLKSVKSTVLQFKV